MLIKTEINDKQHFLHTMFFFNTPKGMLKNWCQQREAAPRSAQLLGGDGPRQEDSCHQVDGSHLPEDILHDED